LEVKPYYYIMQEREMVISDDVSEEETISHLLGCTVLAKAQDNPTSIVLGSPFLKSVDLWFHFAL